MILDLREDEVFELLLTLGAASKGRLSKERRQTAQNQAKSLQATLGQVRALQTLTRPPPPRLEPKPVVQKCVGLWWAVVLTWVGVAALAYALWTCQT